jgi:hypothetical protein
MASWCVEFVILFTTYSVFYVACIRSIYFQSCGEIATAEACWVEIVTSFCCCLYCIFFFHPCIVKNFEQQQRREVMNRINRSFYNCVPVFGIGAMKTVTVNTDLAMTPAALTVIPTTPIYVAVQVDQLSFGPRMVAQTITTKKPPQQQLQAGAQAQSPPPSLPAPTLQDQQGPAAEPSQATLVASSASSASSAASASSSSCAGPVPPAVQSASQDEAQQPEPQARGAAGEAQPPAAVEQVPPATGEPATSGSKCLLMKSPCCK